MNAPAENDHELRAEIAAVTWVPCGKPQQRMTTPEGGDIAALSSIIGNGRYLVPRKGAHDCNSLSLKYADTTLSAWSARKAVMAQFAHTAS